jgi:poly(3-hydroxybutyrate) depolymerase
MMKKHRKIGSLAMAVIPSLAFFSLRAQAQDLPVGKIIERVVCLKDAGQSYALYLPPNYTTDRRWPVIYAFDPAARGTRPVERFKDAAEKYGYIIVGSNNSRNFPDRPLAEIINAMFDDTQTRFSIDRNRVYTAGMSGGARVAGMVAQSLAQSLGGGAAGVILCGAGFSEAKTPEKPLPFPVFGVAGVEDFNGLREAPEFARRADELRSSREVKDRLKQEKAAEQAQRQRSQEFFAAREQLNTAENPAVAMMGIKSMISDLRKKAASRDESVERLAARRALGAFYVSMNEEANRLRAAKKYKEAAASLALAAEIRPDNPQIFFSLARACALGGDKKQALDALKKAVELGFTNADEIAGNADFASIRNEAAYKRLIEDARQKAPSEKR